MIKRIVPELPRSIRLAALTAASVLLLAACAGGASPSAIAPAEQATMPVPQGTRPSGPVTIDISESDDGFAPTEITVNVGQKVTFNFTNNGEAVHNMRIAGPDGSYNTSDDAFSDPPIVVAGQNAKIDWQAPAQPAKVIFRCDYHPNRMGIITVR